MSARRRVDVFVYGHWGWVWQPARLRCAQHLGAPSYQRVYRLEEARAVGAQVLRDKLARRLGLTRRRRVRLLAWSRNYSPPCVETVDNSVNRTRLGPQAAAPTAPLSRPAP